MPINTALTSLLDIDHPILLAPMAGVAGGAVCGSVFYTATESLAHGNSKRAAIAADAEARLRAAPQMLG